MEKLITRHFKIPQDKVGLVIGKGGANIKNVQQATGATLRVKNGDSESFVVMKGTEDALDEAEEMITSLINKPRKPVNTPSEFHTAFNFVIKDERKARVLFNKYSGVVNYGHIGNSLNKDKDLFAIRVIEDEKPKSLVEEFDALKLDGKEGKISMDSHIKNIANKAIAQKNPISLKIGFGKFLFYEAKGAKFSLSLLKEMDFLSFQKELVQNSNNFRNLFHNFFYSLGPIEKQWGQYLKTPISTNVYLNLTLEPFMQSDSWLISIEKIEGKYEKLIYFGKPKQKLYLVNVLNRFEVQDFRIFLKSSEKSVINSDFILSNIEIDEKNKSVFSKKGDYKVKEYRFIEEKVYKINDLINLLVSTVTDSSKNPHYELELQIEDLSKNTTLKEVDADALEKKIKALVEQARSMSDLKFELS